MKKKNIIFFIILLQLCVHVFVTKSYAKHLHKEKVYQEYCAKENNAVDIEYRLPDKARVDIVTKEYAIEVDFSSKWAEAVGQSLYYAEILHLKPGIVLIVENICEYRFVFRIMILCNKYNIKLFIITPDDLDYILGE